MRCRTTTSAGSTSHSTGPTRAAAPGACSARRRRGACGPRWWSARESRAALARPRPCSRRRAPRHRPLAPSSPLQRSRTRAGARGTAVLPTAGRGPVRTASTAQGRMPAAPESPTAPIRRGDRGRAAVAGPDPARPGPDPADRVHTGHRPDDRPWPSLVGHVAADRAGMPAPERPPYRSYRFGYPDCGVRTSLAGAPCCCSSHALSQSESGRGSVSTCRAPAAASSVRFR